MPLSYRGVSVLLVCPVFYVSWAQIASAFDTLTGVRSGRGDGHPVEAASLGFRPLTLTVASFPSSPCGIHVADAMRWPRSHFILDTSTW